MTDQRLAQVHLYNAHGYYHKTEWKPDNRQEVEQAAEFGNGLEEDQLGTIANGEVVEKPKPKVSEPAKGNRETTGANANEKSESGIRARFAPDSPFF